MTPFIISEGMNNFVCNVTLIQEHYSYLLNKRVHSFSFHHPFSKVLVLFPLNSFIILTNLSHVLVYYMVLVYRFVEISFIDEKCSKYRGNRGFFIKKKQIKSREISTIETWLFKIWVLEKSSYRYLDLCTCLFHCTRLEILEIFLSTRLLQCTRLWIMRIFPCTPLLQVLIY